MHSDDNLAEAAVEETQETQLDRESPDGNNGNDDVEDLSEETQIEDQGLIGNGSEGAHEEQEKIRARSNRENRTIVNSDKDNTQVECDEEVKHIKVKRSKDIIHNILTGGFSRTEGISRKSNNKGKGKIKTYIKDQMPTTDTAAMLMLRRDARGSGRLTRGVNTTNTDLESRANEHVNLINTLAKRLKIGKGGDKTFRTGASISKETLIQAEAAAVQFSALSHAITNELAAHRWSIASWTDPHAAEIVDIYEKAKKDAKEQGLKLNHTSAELELICLSSLIHPYVSCSCQTLCYTARR
jgi:hypothetical protein